jgi:hypothetical protein
MTNRCDAECPIITLLCKHVAHFHCFLKWFTAHAPSDNLKPIACPTCANKSNEELPVVPEGMFEIRLQSLGGFPYPMIIVGNTPIESIFNKANETIKYPKEDTELTSHGRILDRTKYAKDYNGIHTAVVALVFKINP